ncbi:hypothetical protein G6F62_014730 [Rhizopus arrhizus]|nr:hypothetical protein G6F62_014730 [Rhizopus arrhizus]
MRQLAAGMREADDEGGVALVHGQPFGMGIHACGSTVGNRSLRPCASAPLRTVTTPEQFADAVRFFASPWSRSVTGQNLVVDGGLVKN